MKKRRAALTISALTAMGLALSAPHSAGVGLTGAHPGWPWIVICGDSGAYYLNALTGERRDDEREQGGAAACHLQTQRRKSDVARPFA